MLSRPEDERAAGAALAEGWWPAAAIAPLGEGHIHATWLVDPVDPARGRGVLQRISTAVFADPVALMEKIEGVVAHVEARAPGWVPALHPTRSGASWHRTVDGSCWRLWRFVAGTRTLQSLTTPAQAEAAGRAFGRFQQLLRDFPCAVADPIPGFMQLDHYLARLDAVRDLAGANPERAAIAGLLERVDQRAALARTFMARDRLIHGDCKVNNLLFHPERDEVVCVLDLDTVMRGHWAWDAGDLIRSASADAQGLSVERFAAVARGLREAGGIVAAPEDWVLAPRYVTLMLGVRFLTDHLEGDCYFRVEHAGQNLERARVQFRLLEAFERGERAMLAALRRTGIR